MAKKSAGMRTGKIPLEFAQMVSKAANDAFADGNGPMMDAVTPVTRTLLKFWFTEPFTFRPLNFHEGQRQAILNVIYLHEMLKVGNIRSAYAQMEAMFETSLLADGGGMGEELAKDKYAYPKYLVKMATGTGKTWVMHALLIWQYLNARAEKGEKSGRWTKNFVFVAPGLIVYERLLDAFQGKRRHNSEARDFTTSDIKAVESLFVPPEYRDAVFAFLQNGLVRKEDFGRKVTGDGVLAVMNWHGFIGDAHEGEDEESDAHDPEGKKILDDLLPAKPGVAVGNSLESLDAQFLRGGRLDFLRDLPDLMMVNDEAHHIHGGNADKSDEEDEVMWQKGIDLLSEGKGERFFQLDFSATPYKATGSGENATKNYFPHVVVNYDLKAAIQSGKVKTIMLDQRKEITDAAPMDYKAVREGNDVKALSEGQRMMLRAGLTKLKYLENEFKRLRPDKHPKMMVVCEDTKVTPFVSEFLKDEGVDDDDILEIDSNKKGDVGEKEWEKVKGRLFGLDKSEKPRIVVSVLMLREGFDVNNICVIVPLRASKAQILLEQTLGRGLRLMWREEEFKEVKEIARHKVLVEKSNPDAVLDFLYIIEHPEFMKFYQTLLDEGLIGEGGGADVAGGGTSDLVTSTLKDGYERYDMFWPVVLKERDEVISDMSPWKVDLKPFTAYSLAQLKDMLVRPGEKFISNEITENTRFGEYQVSGNLFSAESYNEYLQRIVGTVFQRFTRITGKQTKRLPALQVQLADVVAMLDEYIRERLFCESFDPMNGEDWKVLIGANGLVTRHIVRQIGELVHAIETKTDESPAIVEKRWFSELRSFIVRRECSAVLTKTIYTRTGFPTKGGGLESDFMEFVDNDADVDRFVKINEAKHLFARIAYLRDDGLMGEYVPDFLVLMGGRIYVIETKADKDKDNANVQRKRLAATQWCKAINELPEDERMNCEWRYAILTDEEFYRCRDRHCTFKDVCAVAEITELALQGELFSFE
jgi:type III restriction enzyme